MKRLSVVVVLIPNDGIITSTPVSIVHMLSIVILDTSISVSAPLTTSTNAVLLSIVVL